MPNGCFAYSPVVEIKYKDCGYKMVRGFVYEDLNSNDTYNPKTERIFPNVKVSIVDSLGKNLGFAFSNLQGIYEFKSKNFYEGYYNVTIADPE